ncbi:MAG: HAMP domain-containing histidine kinase [Pirellulaceae bacterium]|jgi:signal transduction histidine kinase|nr:HAMP domain-containing histidine kinase [Pirellulaceae bacterium]
MQTRTRRPPDLPSGSPGSDVELQAVLAAWHTATDRLQQTHEALRREVRRLTDELEVKNRALARKNRLADLGQMASHVAHEVRNSLVPLTLYLSLLRRHLGGNDYAAQVLDKITAGLSAMEVLVSDLLQFTAHRDPQWQTFDLEPLVREVCDALAPQLAAQGIRAELDIPAALSVRADRDMLRRATLNLVLNALDVMPQGGELTVTGTAGPYGVELEIADSGPGIEQSLGPRLFEPFFTTKRGGTGLGLAIVERIAAAHGGTVMARNCPQGGAAFTIRLPARVLEAAA